MEDSWFFFVRIDVLYVLVGICYSVYSTSFVLFCSKFVDVLKFSVLLGNFSQEDYGAVESILPTACGRCVGDSESSVSDGFSYVFSSDWSGGAHSVLGGGITAGTG